MKDLTNEMKAKYFAATLGCDVDISSTEYYQEQAKWNNPVTDCKLFGVRSDIGKDWNIAFLQTNITTQNEGVLMLSVEVCSLLLMPMSAISDEDRKYVAKLLQIFQEDVLDWLTGDYIHEDFHSAFQFLPTIDYLRSKGYATDWNGYTVDQLIQAGWLQLTIDKK